MEKTILFVDNTFEFLDVHARLLELRGYRVIRATSVEEADDMLTRFNIHLAILDIRLEAENDALDISGLSIAKNEAYRYLPKIILTGHPSWEYAEIALGAGLKGLQVVDMIVKTEETDHILDAVDQAFAEHVSINWTLQIRENNGGLLRLSHLVSSIDPTLISDLTVLRSEEIQELLRRLFLEHEQIIIDKVIAHHPGRVWFIVSAFSEQDHEHSYLVTCGKRPLINLDQENFNNYVPQGQLNAPIITWEAETRHYAGYATALPGISDFDDLTTLFSLFQSQSTEQVVRGLDKLFETNLSPWYQTSRSWEPEGSIHELVNHWLNELEMNQFILDLSLRIESIFEQARAKGIVNLEYSSRFLTLHLAEQEQIILPNPLSIFEQLSSNIEGSVLYGNAHGRLDGTAVLADAQDHFWVVDFTHLNRGPLLQDFICLENAIKFDMVNLPKFNERFELEDCLTTFIDQNSPDQEANNFEVSKATQAINMIRKWAVTIGIKTPHYQLGLIIHALSSLTTYQIELNHSRRELLPYIHRIISAAMTQQQLTKSSQPNLPTQAITGLWLNEDKQEVWVEGQSIDLTPQEYELLLYFYTHAGENRSRDMILKDVFQLVYPQLTEKERRNLSDPRINSAVSRLRKKIESDPSNPKYLLSVWGSGYRLNLKG